MCARKKCALTRIVSDLKRPHKNICPRARWMYIGEIGTAMACNLDWVTGKGENRESESRVGFTGSVLRILRCQ